MLLSRSSRVLVALVACLSLSALVPAPPADARSSARKTLKQGIDAARIQQDVNWLAAPERKGRGLGTPELDEAADYLARKLKAGGLPGAARDGGYFQTFEITTDITLGAENRLEAGPVGKAAPLKLSEGWQPLGFSDTGAAEGELVFAGYGISAPELKYDDYEGIDVKDRVVVVLRGIPGGTPAGAFLVNGAERFGQLRYKALAARERGAKAILFVDRAERGDLIPLPKGHVTSSAGIIAAHLARAQAKQMLATGLDLDAVQARIDSSQAPASKAVPGVLASIKISLEKKIGTGKNVVAKLEGSDPKLKDEVIVIGAHYDHLGLGGESSLAPEQYGKAHVGADDNASGTSAVLELARYFAAGPRLPRTLVFALFTAEEVGLGGSSHYVRSPLFPIENTVLMVNLDMVGRLRDNKVSVQGVDTAEGMRERITGLAKGLNLTPGFTGDGYGPSDHTPFYARAVPVLFFFTGAHSDYHRPSDTADKINAPGIVSVATLVAHSVEGIAREPERPKYVRLSAAPPPDHSGGGGGQRGYGAYLGTIPDFTETPGGVAITGVRPGSPAEQAGLKGGDVLIRLGGQNLQNLQDFTYALKAHKPGDVVEIVFRRDGTEQTVKATLGKRQ